jgi:HEAT repeat protein
MVLDNLWNLRDFQKNAATAGVFVTALDASETWLISMAHFRIQTSGYFGLVPAAEVRTRAIAHLKHADPGVRGRAIRTLAAIATAPADKETAGAEAERLLTDAHPYVRAEAINSIGKLQRKSAIPTIGKLLDDKGHATYDIAGFTLPTGEAGTVHHDGSPWSRVDDAVIISLKTLTSSLGAGKYNFTPIRWDHKDEDLATAVADAKKWLAAYKP